ncbi:Tol-Pal system beta propeller repeat protein TolB [Hydrogenophaga sp. 5NK40-0174]|uniref:Tol-Pal system beta propeller repeat protein TolB n=1 Tax=Hydrogenophaga sp. 5NK40-0174 TaxID=3127649 RepID=UPI003102977C
MHHQTRSDASSPSRRTLLKQAATASLLTVPALEALAQFRVEVTGVGMKQIPFSIAPFSGNEGLSQDVAAIIQADLERSGEFRFVPPVAGGFDETSRPDMVPWRERSTDALVVGSVKRLADGRFDITARLWDVVRGVNLGGMGFTVDERGLRIGAHRTSDFVYEKLTGVKGVFSTRIAYVAKNGRNYQLRIADADGENSASIFNSNQSIISPAWAPDGRNVAYVSFEARKPVIRTQNIGAQTRRLLASFRGSNSAPAWSPDGNSVVATLSLSGNSQLYSIPAGGGSPRRLSQSSDIDTEPAFSGDGSSIYFVSNRGGSAQIYRMGANGGAAQRITFGGNYNVSPTISPDGKYMAFISRVSGGDRLHLMDLASGNVTALTNTSDDESPSFAPNGRLIMYATRVQGREALMTTTLDGRIRTQLARASGDIFEPAWGPFTSRV